MAGDREGAPGATQSTTTLASTSGVPSLPRGAAAAIFQYQVGSGSRAPGPLPSPAGFCGAEPRTQVDELGSAGRALKIVLCHNQAVALLVRGQAPRPHPPPDCLRGAANLNRRLSHGKNV
jgi:hypothetical protein